MEIRGTKTADNQDGTRAAGTHVVGPRDEAEDIEATRDEGDIIPSTSSRDGSSREGTCDG